MTNRYKELFDELKPEYGTLPAAKLARQEYINELICDLTEEDLTVQEQLDKIITVLEMMNAKAALG
jgi:hypothetical protein